MTYGIGVLRHLLLGIENVVVETTRSSVEVIERLVWLEDVAIVGRRTDRDHIKGRFLLIHKLAGQQLAMLLRESFGVSSP